MNDFRRLLRELVTHYGGTKQDLARAVGITPSTLSHLLKRDAGKPSTEVCLRLAAATGMSASKILRAAGKGEVAELLEDLYGDAASRRLAFAGLRLTPHEERYVTAWRALDPKAQRAFYLILQAAIHGRIAAPVAVLTSAKEG